MARGELTTEQDDAAQDEDLDQQFAYFGLVPEGPVDAPTPEFCIWPVNVPVWELWLACRTQWVHGLNGPTGLNYPGVEVVMARRRIPLRKRDRCFELLQVMERASLAAWQQMRDELEAQRPRG